MINKPKVTVTMPAYNAAEFISEAIESVLNQTYNDYELLIIDDGSTDETLKIIKSYKSHPKIRWYTQNHLGIGATRNRLVRMARGEYISICDADDKILPNKLKRHTEILDKDPDIAVIYGHILIMNKNGKIRKRKDPYLMARNLDNWWDLLENAVMHCGSTVRKSAILKVGGYDKSTVATEDYDLWLKLAEIYKFKYLNEPFAVSRFYSESTSKHNKQYIRDVIKVKKNAIMRRYGNHLAPKFKW